ncbi:hypothetical protein SAZ11_59830 [Streptomyces sp. FXJ1.4098]|uniref:hypothetical protein n=1 Tax=Streptomyces sp. NPDC020845 TaxID=3365096 RepID=UPI0029925CED|nr:hypothetical protein [Streptomyces sp. FXJ1.4098]
MTALSAAALLAAGITLAAAPTAAAARTDIRCPSASMYAEAKYGGTGVGVSVGAVSVTSQVKAALGVRNGNMITVTRNA